MQLPKPEIKGSVSIEEVLQARRSIRSYSDAPLNLTEISQLLWSAYGVTSPKGLRTAPSAKELYPLELYIVSGEVNGLPPGVYKYLPGSHSIEKLGGTDIRPELFETTFDQASVREGRAVIVFAAVYSRTKAEFGDAGRDLTHMDLGHSAQNLHLQAVSLNIGTVVIAAFRPDDARKVLGLADDEVPLYLMPLGKLP